MYMWVGLNKEEGVHVKKRYSLHPILESELFSFT